MYLSRIVIEKFRGIKKLDISFNESINILIGENGSFKSAVIDAIRLLYNIGEPMRSISVFDEDFHEEVLREESGISIVSANEIRISYEFRGLSEKQKGAFYDYMVIDGSNSKNDYASVVLTYQRSDSKNPSFRFGSGLNGENRPEYQSFELFQHYYLGALRDSTKDLLSTRGNILGKVIKKHVDRNETEAEIAKIVQDANKELLKRGEVVDTRDGVNTNLSDIFRGYSDNKIGLQIEQSKTEYIVNIIKPFLPHDQSTLQNEGFNLWQNSLGHNNLIYIATVLGDIREQIKDNAIPHYALLIEEPEAHLHPQLQLSLYNFLKNANSSENSQLFVTTHSPTLTSKVPLESLILLDKESSIRISGAFDDRECEELIQDTTRKYKLKNNDFLQRRRLLERYIDVTKSQLFFAKSILFVEGISEELIVTAISSLKDDFFEANRIEVVNVGGTSFYPFIYLFNSVSQDKRINKKITILTDDDVFTDSKKSDYSLDNLIKDNYKLLKQLDNSIQTGKAATRVDNLNSISKTKNILVSTAKKTFEYELACANISDSKTDLPNNFLFKYMESEFPDKAEKVKKYVDSLISEKLSVEEKRMAGILLWKCFPGKGDFSQYLSLSILDNKDNAKKSFVVPDYILKGLEHVKRNGI